MSGDALRRSYLQLRNEFERSKASDEKALAVYRKLRDQFDQLQSSGEIALRAYRRTRDEMRKLEALLEAMDEVLVAIVNGGSPSLDSLGRLPHNRAVWLARIAERAGVVEPTFWHRLAHKTVWCEVDVGEEGRPPGIPPPKYWSSSESA